MSITTNKDTPLTFNNTDNSWQYMQFRTNGLRKAWMGIDPANNFCLTKENGGGIKISGALNLHYSSSNNWSNAFRSNVKGSYVKTMIVSLNGSDLFYVTGNGNAWAKGYFASSDRNLKKDIAKIDNALNKVLKLEGVSYKFKNDFELTSSKIDTDTVLAKEVSFETNLDSPNSNYNNSISEKTEKEKERKHLGLIAQDVELIVPEVVRTAADGSLAIDYTNLIGLLVEAMKEQQVQIEELKSNKSQKLKSTAEPIQNNSEINATLSQNRPNPFNQETTIDFYLASTISTANLYIYDLQGKQIKSMDIVQREYGSITIYASELQAGMYKYALVADGAIIGTETMILTE